MIRRVFANKSSFQTVHLQPGMNIVLADTTTESTRKDSRNGLGKTTLLEVIHFCLGGQATKSNPLLIPALADWSFSLELELAGKPVIASRGTRDHKRIVVEGDPSAWPLKPKADPDTQEQVFSVGQWTKLLGALLFGLPTDGDKRPFAPSFRGLMGYLARSGDGAFLNPFEAFPKQKTYQTQVENSFLLGLSWEDSRDWEVLRGKASALKSLRKAHRILGASGESVGELNAEKVRLEARAAEVSESLASFKVHERYKEIEVGANQLTAQIHELANANVGDRRLIELYEASMASERVPDSQEVARMYENASVSLPGAALRRLEEVQSFHEQVVRNRRAFLAAEVERLRSAVLQRDAQIQNLTAQRAEALTILQTHGALDEYSKLQAHYLGLAQRVKDLESRIASLRQAQEGEGALKIELELLAKRARSDYEERRAARDAAIRFFNDYSQELYATPGSLIIDIDKNGVRFDVEIQRSGSTGIDQMKVFFYDLTLATLWARRDPSPRLLIHDSALFADVDERQVAAALQLAARVSAREGFTYLCMLNSDKVPRDLFAPTFDFDSYVRVRLTDVDDRGRLLGIRFDRQSAPP